MRLSREIATYGFIKFLPALVMLGMNIIYYKYLTKDEYILFLSSMAVHLTFLQVTGGWLGAAQSYYFAKGLGKAPTLDLIQKAGIRPNLVLWVVEFCVLLLSSSSWLVGLLAVVLTITQTQILAISTRLQLSGKMREQLEITTIFCGLLALLTLIIIATKSASTAGFLGAHISAALIALAWTRFKIYPSEETRDSVTVRELIPIIKYAIPMAAWFFLLATNSYLDRYLLNLFYSEINPKNYLLTKELTQGVISLLTAPFIMVAHVRIFNAFRDGNNGGAEKSMLQFASMTLVICLIAMPFLDLAFKVAIRSIVNAEYVHNHSVFLFNYVGILAICISMYAQKGLEVAGKNKVMVYIIFLTLAMQLGMHFIFREYVNVVKFAAINLLAGIFFLLLSATLANSVLRFRVTCSKSFAGLVATSFVYLLLQVISDTSGLEYKPILWYTWFLLFVFSSIQELNNIFNSWPKER